MQTDTAIRTRRDGSIDTAYYIAKGRHARSRQAHQMGRSTGQGLARTAGVWAAVLCVFAVLPFLA